MIDDTKENLETASKLGIQTALFRSSRQLRAELETPGFCPDLSQRPSGESEHNAENRLACADGSHKGPP